MSASSVASTLVTLNTGEKAPEVMVTAVTKQLAAFYRKDPAIVAELVALARDPKGDMLTPYREALRSLGMVERTPLNDDACSIVLAATMGTDWFELELIHPLRPRPLP